MPEVLLSDELSPNINYSCTESGQGSNRRTFLKTAAVASAGLGLALVASKSAFAQSNEAGIWRDRVTHFIYTVSSQRRAPVLINQLSRASISWAPATRDFHYFFAAPLIFVGATIDPEVVICSNGFEVNRFPLYDINCPCSGVNDLNAFEIKRISHAAEITRLGCVVAPHSTRQPLQYADHAEYRRTAAEYGLNPDSFKPEYKRVFRGNGRSRKGFHVSHRTDVGANGKPLRDVLLSSEDF